MKNIRARSHEEPIHFTTRIEALQFLIGVDNNHLWTPIEISENDFVLESKICGVKVFITGENK